MYKKNVMSTLLLQMWKIVFNLLFSVLVARSVGTIVYGQISYFFLIFNMISSYGHLGVINGIGYCAKTDKTKLPVQFNTNMSYLLCNGLAILLLICEPHIKNIILPEYSYRAVLIGMLYAFFSYMQSAIEGYYVYKERIVHSNVYWMIGMSIVMAGMLICIVLKLVNFQNYILLKTLEIGIVALLLYRFSGFSYRLQFDFGFFKRELKYGNIIFWASLFGFLNYRIDQIMINVQLGNAMLGIYSVAVTLAELVLLIPNSVNLALTGKLLNVDERNKKQVVCFSLKLSIYICIILVVIGNLMSPLIVSIYGEEYYRSISAFSILLVGVCGASIAKIIYPYFITNGHAMVHLIVSTLTMIINIIMNFLLIGKYGIDGAAIASTISYFFYGGIYIILFKNKEKAHLKELIILSKEERNILKKSLFKIFSR